MTDSPSGVTVATVLRDLAPHAASPPDSEHWRPWRSYALMHLWNTLMPDTSAPKET